MGVDVLGHSQCLLNVESFWAYRVWVPWLESSREINIFWFQIDLKLRGTSGHRLALLVRGGAAVKDAGGAGSLLGL